MSTKTLKSTFRRSGLLVAAFALVAATVLPAASSYADALNPLTERSLTLSSASPGWSYLDASGNGTFAPPNSGANGNKTGNTFTFKVSSAEELQSFTFQYCTTPAGDCKGPGNNDYSGSGREANGPLQYAQKKSDLSIVTNNPSEVTTWGTKFDPLLGQPARYQVDNVNDPQWDSNTVHPNSPAADGSEGNYIVLHKAPSDTNWTFDSGWTMTATERQTYQGNPSTSATEQAGHTTGKANYIKLSKGASDTDPGVTLAAGDQVKIIFFGTDDNYITNPGNKEFFVKINTYSDPTVESDATLVDGGVTVANVMNRSIEIQTKVLETMDFSVGTVDPNTLDSTDTNADPGIIESQFKTATGKDQHGPCDPVVQGMNTSTANNVLKLGDEAGEFSLRTDTTYSTHSYWRLSSNSSGGATVYYSGVTLSNTVGDQIKAIGTDASAPIEGSEQFGLAVDNVDAGNTSGTKEVSYAKERTPAAGPLWGIFQNGEDNDVAGVHATTTAAVGANPSYHSPRLAPLTAFPDYANGTGAVNSEYSTLPDSSTAFAFDPESSAIPAPFASGTEVLDCATAKMRYIANIAATTPAGVYTTKINYIAAPKY